MDLYIQMGHGMQKLGLDLLAAWGGGTLILSPMNIKPNSIVEFSNTIHKLNGTLMIDPQLYYPRQYQKNLSQYSYWPQKDITSLEAGGFDNVIKSLTELNRAARSSAFILPTITTNKIEDRWNYVQKNIIESALRYGDAFELLHTIALSSDVLIDETQVEKIVAYVEDWDINGVYIVCEHPERYYLINKPLWVSNLLALVAGIKRLHKKVVVGYASHQMLCLALSKCDAIASGNFLNVRWFQPEHFETLDSEEINRRALWYYCPQVLSEFKIPFLDIAKRMGILDVLAPPIDMMNPYCEMLFGAGLPSSTSYSEKESHRHYLYCFHQQCLSTVRSTYEETKNAHLIMLETAERLLSGLRTKGIKGQNRDFSEIVDVNRAAIAAHDMAYQFPLSREWDSL